MQICVAVKVARILCVVGERDLADAKRSLTLGRAALWVEEGSLTSCQ